MQGGTFVWGLIALFPLACGSHVPHREFKTDSGGISSGGTAVGGARQSTGGAAVTAGTANRGGAGGAGGMNASSGATGSTMCTSDVECAAQPHVRASAPAHCSAGKCLIPPASCEDGFGHCSASEDEFCETDLRTPTRCGSCDNACPSSKPLCTDGKCASACGAAKPTNCGESCAVPNSAVSCMMGACSVTCSGKPEDCFNDKDDDCDGQIDCADSDCTPTRAVCVPSTTFAYGVPIDAQATCPASFLGTPVTIHSSLNTGTGCTGCTCTPSTTDCAPVQLNLYNYAASDACTTQGTVVASYTLPQLTATCTPLTLSATYNSMSWTPKAKSNCTPGKATLSPAQWQNDNKFCSTNITGAGCGAGNVCVPVANGASLLADGDQTCPANFPSKRLVYDGFTDNRVCKCSCEGYGGNCDNVLLKLSTNSSDCTGNSFLASTGGGGQCAPGAAFTQLAYTLTGTATPPTSCQESNDLTGTITTNGVHTLCL